MKYNIGGKTVETARIGKLVVLRQHLLWPGERLNASITGNVRLAALRSTSAVYLHAGIYAFAAPLRWYQLDFPDYIKEGRTTIKTIDQVTTPWPGSHASRRLGIGHPQEDFAKWFVQHPTQVHNRWFKWPEDTDASITSPVTTFWDPYGPKCVNLKSAPTRIRDAPTIDSTESEVASATEFDVRNLALIQARFQQAAKTDWSAQDRYIPFLQDIWKGAKGSNEVDKIPMQLRNSAQLSVSPEDMYATDGPSLGQISSLNNFNVDHKWAPFIAPEHMIVCYMMLLRFKPVFADGISPMAYMNDMTYADMQGDPNVMAHLQPVNVKSREVEQGDATVIGVLPAGWKRREGFNHIGRRPEEISTFAFLDGAPETAEGLRDASLITNAFETTVLDHALADLDFDCIVDSQMPTAGDSIMAGSISSAGKPAGLHPTGGYLK